MPRHIQAKVINPLLGDAMSVPAYATAGSAAMDLRACIHGPVTIQPGANALINTGLAVNMTDPGLVALICSRSGLALKHRVFVLNAPGVIDSDYTGEMGVILANMGSEPFTVNSGDRIAQLMFQPVVQVELTYVDEFSGSTSRGAAGYGSTGQN